MVERPVIDILVLVIKAIKNINLKKFIICLF
jgi:hypothetical protein